MSVEIQEMPEQGEIILATITKVMDHGAYVTLDEYDEIQGFLHISEIAPGWIRSVSRFVKDGEKKVLLVKKVNTKRGDIDLSLKQVSKDQKKQKLKEVKKYEKGKTLLQNVQEKADLSDEEIEKIEDKIYSKFDSVYDAFIEIGRNGIESVKELKFAAFDFEVTDGFFVRNEYKRNIIKDGRLKNKLVYLYDCLYNFLETYNITKLNKEIKSSLKLDRYAPKLTRIKIKHKIEAFK